MIAEKVMGLIPSEYMGRTHWKKHEFDWASFVIEQRDYDKNRTQGDPQPIPLPYYSTDIKSAFEVLSKATSVLGNNYKPILFKDDEIWHCGFFQNYFDCYDFEGKSSSAPHAICMAALNAMGEK